MCVFFSALCIAVVVHDSVVFFVHLFGVLFSYYIINPCAVLSMECHNLNCIGCKNDEFFFRVSHKNNQPVMCNDMIT